MPGADPALVLRRASRLLVIDSEGRVLLFQYARPLGELFWGTPGGGLEEGETFESAALREAREELGLEEVEAVSVHERTTEFPWGNVVVRQQERYFLLRLSGIEFRSEVLEAQRREGILASRWWSLSEIVGAEAPIFPNDLGALVVRVAGRGTP